MFCNPSMTGELAAAEVSCLCPRSAWNNRTGCLDGLLYVFVDVVFFEQFVDKCVDVVGFCKHRFCRSAGCASVKTADTSGVGLLRRSRSRGHRRQLWELPGTVDLVEGQPASVSRVRLVDPAALNAVDLCGGAHKASKPEGSVGSSALPFIRHRVGDHAACQIDFTAWVGRACTRC